MEERVCTWNPQPRDLGALDQADRVPQKCQFALQSLEGQMASRPHLPPERAHVLLSAGEDDGPGWRCWILG